MGISRFIGLPVLLLIGVQAAAQSQADLSAQMQAALKNNDATAALSYADKLYALTVEERDFANAGKTAFSRGKILASMNKNQEAGKAYGLCDEHYAAINGAAQSLNCRYESAQAYIDAGKSGTGLAALKSTAKSLEEIGQGKSGLAARVYLSLADEILPSKIEAKKSAIRYRKASIDYADKAMAALEALGKNKSQRYTSALFIKAKALEDSKKYKESADVYKKGIAMYMTLPGASMADLKNAATRITIVEGMATGNKSDNTLTVKDSDGNKVVLTIKKKRQIRFPRIDRKKLVDGARARAEITLNADGTVATLKILESMPESEFGDALEKGVRKWVFSAPDGVSLADLPPFEYGMTFFVKRR